MRVSWRISTMRKARPTVPASASAMGWESHTQDMPRTHGRVNRVEADTRASRATSSSVTDLSWPPWLTMKGNLPLVTVARDWSE